MNSAHNLAPAKRKSDSSQRIPAVDDGADVRQHWVCEFGGAIYDLSAGQYMKRVAECCGQESLNKFTMAIGTGVFSPALHDEFMVLVAKALKL